MWIFTANFEWLQKVKVALQSSSIFWMRLAHSDLYMPYHFCATMLLSKNQLGWMTSHIFGVLMRGKDAGKEETEREIEVSLSAFKAFLWCWSWESSSGFSHVLQEFNKHVACQCLSCVNSWCSRTNASEEEKPLSSVHTGGSRATR